MDKLTELLILSRINMEKEDNEKMLEIYEKHENEADIRDYRTQWICWAGKREIERQNKFIKVIEEYIKRED